MQNIFADLKARGLVFQTTNGIEEHLATGSRTLYCGFDPTADSLHIGSLVPLLTLRRFQQAGHRPVVLVGGATGMIGDPSFKAQERKLNDEATIRGWVEKLKIQTSRFVSFKAEGNQPAALMANNYDWTHGLSVLEFLRDIGKHFSVNSMISKDAVKSRLEREDTGISYTEFSYALLQALDFDAMYTNPEFNCTVQIGGSDQWGNIVAGTELIRKKSGGQAFALTLPLVTKADGTKFGKTESGTIWLDAAKTSPYAFYQFWLNTADADVENFLKFFSFRPVAEISTLVAEHAKAPEKRLAQTALAEEVTALVHGTHNLEAAQRITAALFGGDLASLTEEDYAQLAQDGLPTTGINSSGGIIGLPFAMGSTFSVNDNKLAQFENNKDPQKVIQSLLDNNFLDVNQLDSLNTKSNPCFYFIAKFNGSLEIVDGLLLAGLAKSKREAKEFIENNSVEINGFKTQYFDSILNKQNAKYGKYHLLRRGKKNFALLVLE